MTAQLDEALRRATTNLPPSMQQKLQQGLSNWHSNENKSLSMLVTGKTGSGKSTLTNAILGIVKDSEAAVEGSNIRKNCTKELEMFEQNKNGVNIAVWDSAGLQDGTKYQDDYVSQMKQQCTEVELFLYCINVSETRFVQGNDNPDVVAMKKLTVAFGPDFWQKTVIILTYANLLEAFNVDWIDLSVDKKAEVFLAKLKEWEKQIKKILIEDIRIPVQIVRDIRVVPAGLVKNPHLPGQEYWLSNLWFQCLYTMTSSKAQCALLQMNMSRFRNEKEVQKEDFEQSAELQPIVIVQNILTKVLSDDSREMVLAGLKSGAALGTAVAGPGSGAFIGAICGAAVALALASTKGIGKAMN